ncbi:hypothetical protein [Nitrolancea hollandica]|uniref:Uncharacterized protein n=1 Tax=Nitrolancea hollandica Lb TaxID=1129897 RepID=I4EH07_9BACT|nr:hypothetical protein [Nitrolancea hollandica]CCF83969.1 exported hypothetical protein [Nitrolancea hollandica Lb]
MARHSVIFALLSMTLLATAVGLAYLQLALPAVILGGLAFVLALAWFGSVLLREPAKSPAPSQVERRGIRDTLDRIRHALGMKYGVRKAISGRRRTPHW